MKKPRSDSKLANLPGDTQAEIAAWCKEGLEVARDMLRAKKGIVLSLSSLSCWYAWYRRQEQLQSGNARVQQTLEWFRHNRPDATPMEIRNATFLSLSLLHEEDKDFSLKLLQEQGRDMDRELAERRVRVAEAKVEKAKSLLEDGQLTQDQREARLRQVFGIGQ